jgi:hypothetical protein
MDAAMQRDYSSVEHLFAIIDLDLIPEDNYVPDSNQHIVHIVNHQRPTNIPVVPILCTGAQWDMLWWIYRLKYENLTQYLSFDEFLAEFLANVYSNYHKDQ